ncbi:MAG: cysteine--tRNA ligase [Acidilobaceae archaeon]
MSLKIYNTLSKAEEEFNPWNSPLVSMYVCGPTPYDYVHIGHARTFVVFDALKRYLNLKGFSVTHVQNITDIDDKILKKANEENRSWREVVEEYTKDYMSMLEALKIRVDVHPRVTDHIKEIIEFIEGLIEKGYAYVSESGSVYFDVDKYSDYGRLSGRLSKDVWRQEEEVLREKKNPYDFALWKAVKPGEPYWDSPWGPGRPGWHIECSVMSSKYLGSKIDVHGGGADLIFPHHENERAQSEAYFGTSPWVKYWVHIAYLTIEGEKMSKSLGNIVAFREASKKWGSEPLRLWLLSAHYRTPLDYNEQSIQQAAKLYQRLVDIADRTLRRLNEREPAYWLSSKEVKLLQELREFILKWHRELSRDFNLSEAISTVWSFTSFYYKEVEHSESQGVLLHVLKFLQDINRVYAVLDEILESKRVETLEEPLIDLIVKVRSELRARKMYEVSDWIRSELLKLGIRLLDYQNRTEWKRERPSGQSI